MTTQPNLPKSESFYVAPAAPPMSRKPPVTEVGLVGWLRENLFKTPLDSVITVVLFGVIGWMLWGFLSWALLDAQWEIVFLNLRALNLGQQYPLEAVWRAEIIALIVVALGLLSIGVYGRILRGYLIAIAVIIALMLLVPPLTQGVPEPPVYTYADATYKIRQINFLADAGQEITFTVQPLTETDEYRLENISGYMENDNQQANTAFDMYTGASTEVIFTQQRDPSAYDLSLAVQVWDREGEVLAQSGFTEGTTEDTNFTWTAPETGWYTYTMVVDEETPGTVGSALLRADNIEVLRSTGNAIQQRIATYGPPPVLDCAGCNTQVLRTDMRFLGSRTLPQWFSLQLAPFLLEMRPLFFMSLIVGTIAYLIGRAAKRSMFSFLIGRKPDILNINTRGSQHNVPSPVENLLSRIAGIAFIAYMVLHFVGINGANADTVNAYLIVLAIFCTVTVLYALALLARGGPQASGRAVALLWAVSFPIILTLLNGVAGINSMEQIPSDKQGGLILTLLLAAVAIIASFPIGLLLAIGRQSDLPAVSFFCTIFIEVVRGVPLITLLFMGRLILPFFGFGLGDVDLLIRVMVVLTLFTSAYLAEVIRGGLQTIPKGQIEAAHALGINEFYTTTRIVLPQALRAVIPAIMGQAISLFKDTSLVYIIGLFELVGVTNQILSDSQTGYLMYPREAYLFIALIYFVFSYIMAEASRRIERTGSGVVRRQTL